MNPNTATNIKPSLAFRLIRWAFIALLVVSSVVLFLFLLRSALTWVVLPFWVERHVSELARLAGWGRDLAGVAVVAAVFVVSYVAEFVFRRGRRQRWAALGVLAALATGYFGLHGWLTRNHLYSPKGEPLFYWSLTPSGEIYKQPEPGINPYTHQPLLPASAQYLALIRSRLREPLQQVDPATNDWFDFNTGDPLLWWARNSEGALELYKRPAVHPRYRVELQAVTPDLLREWEQDQARRKAEAAAQAEREAKTRREEETRLQAQAQAEKQAQAQAEKQAEERRLETQRLHAEETRRQLEVARTQQADDEARRATAEGAQRTNAEADRMARLRAAGEEADKELERRQIVERRTREAAASARLLESLRLADSPTHEALSAPCPSSGNPSRAATGAVPLPFPSYIPCGFPPARPPMPPRVFYVRWPVQPHLSQPDLIRLMPGPGPGQPPPPGW